MHGDIRKKLLQIDYVGSLLTVTSSILLLVSCDILPDSHESLTAHRESTQLGLNWHAKVFGCIAGKLILWHAGEAFPTVGCRSVFLSAATLSVAHCAPQAPVLVTLILGVVVYALFLYWEAKVARFPIVPGTTHSPFDGCHKCLPCRSVHLPV